MQFYIINEILIILPTSGDFDPLTSPDLLRVESKNILNLNYVP